MNTKANKRKMFVSMVIVVLVLIASVVRSHCQIPCGVYDDNMRFNMMAEHITTIEKSMNEIRKLSEQDKPNMNQIVRWVQNKEEHVDELGYIITYYFMAQRIKPAKKMDAQEYEKYINKLTLLHRMLVSSMKAKQTTDLSLTKQLAELSANFKKAYYPEHEH